MPVFFKTSLVKSGFLNFDQSIYVSEQKKNIEKCNSQKNWQFSIFSGGCMNRKLLNKFRIPFGEQFRGGSETRLFLPCFPPYFHTIMETNQSGILTNAHDRRIWPESNYWKSFQEKISLRTFFPSGKV